MNYKYILKEIRKANEYVIETFDSLNKYEIHYNNKYLAICKEYITEIDEILSNLEIEINSRLEEDNNE
jgi:hypothetical protein